MPTVFDLARIVRSKNAKPFRLTLDVLFKSKQGYDSAVASGKFTREAIAALYKVKPEQVSSIFFVAAANAIKVTLRRPIAQGNIGDSDMYGCQQHVPLMQLEIDAPRG